MVATQARLTRCDRPRCHYDEAGADQRRDELTGLGRHLGEVRVDPGEVGLRRQDADAQQHHAGHRDQSGGAGDREVGLAPARQRAEPLGAPQQHAAAQQDLVAGEQEARQEQRDDVVVQPEHHDRADDLRCAQIGRQSKQDRSVEHADAAGQVGGQPCRVGGDIDAQEDRPGQLWGVWQQCVEDRRGDGDVHRRQHHLDDRHPPARQANLVAEQLDAAQHARQRDVAEYDGPQQRADRVHHPGGRCSPKNGIDRGSRNRMVPPSTMPPSAKVRLQNATVLAICSGVRPQCAYSR